MDQPRDLARFDARRRRAGPGASRISRTCMSSASATASASRADARGRAATSGSRGAGTARRDPRGGAARPRPDHRRHDRCRPLGGMGRVFRRAGAASARLRERTLILPGNHDVNIVDRANPARLDLPTSPGKRLRQMRALSAMAASRATGSASSIRRRGGSARRCQQRWRRIATDIARFADAGTLRLSAGWRSSGPTSFRWCCRPTPRTGSASCCSTRTARNAFLLHQRARPGLGGAGAALHRGRAGSFRRRTGSSRCIIISSNIRSRPRRSRSGSARR